MTRRNPPLDAVISLDARVDRGFSCGARGGVGLTFRGGAGR